MNKKLLRIMLVLLVLFIVLFSVLKGSYFELTTFICKDKTSIENANSSGYKMYTVNEINSGDVRKSFRQVKGVNVLTDSVELNYKAKYTTETSTSYACIIPFFSPIRFNTKVNFNWSILNKTGVVKSNTEKFVIIGKLKFFGYRSIGNIQRLIRQNTSRQVEVEIKKIIELKMKESKK